LKPLEVEESLKTPSWQRRRPLFEFKKKDEKGDETRTLEKSGMGGGASKLLYRQKEGNKKKRP